MVYISDDSLDRLIKEDVPYIDLTSRTLGISGRGKMIFQCREEAVVCGTEEAQRILQKLGIQTLYRTPSGNRVNPGAEVLEAEGEAPQLHMAWKVCQDLLEYYTGVASRTDRMVTRARQADPGVQVVSTRKVIPGTKDLAVKAVLAGGGLPHRLGLSESILVFEQHTNFMGGPEEFISGVQAFKSRNHEKKVIAEAKTLEEGLRLAAAGVDGLQFDKLDDQRLEEAVKRVRCIHPGVILLAAGGIDENNIGDYARSGVDIIVTSAMYFGRPVDFGVRMFVV